MVIKREHLALAKKKAVQSNAKFKVSALGFNASGECVAKATNKIRFCRQGGGLHAEMEIMKQAKRKGVRYILICRVGKGGELRPIDPCKVCAEKAAELGIRITSVPREV